MQGAVHPATPQNSYVNLDSHLQLIRLIQKAQNILSLTHVCWGLEFQLFVLTQEILIFT
jgi:hypothetical protein